MFQGPMHSFAVLGPLHGAQQMVRDGCHFDIMTNEAALSPLICNLDRQREAIRKSILIICATVHRLSNSKPTLSRRLKRVLRHRTSPVRCHRKDGFDKAER